MDNITGYVDHIVYQNSDNGYTVMTLVAEGEEVTCVGMCKGLGQGENISAEGEYIEHTADSSRYRPMRLWHPPIAPAWNAISDPERSGVWAKHWLPES